ncbi:serine hydrolase [Amycolatopsis sp. GM8]|uniref:serine hydrolase domain-containing protein n=1 Tax=Amycolatopsis sp. GM8 TaxID=2896530 RepID=UPI001F2B2170|nr:serine hydrolase domain-containing protein [Amycolatopsis sp. GM8]
MTHYAEQNWAAASDLVLRAGGYAVVVVNRDGATVWVRYASGFDPATAVDIASAQKSVVAMLLARSVHRHRLTNDTAISDILGPGWSRAPRHIERDITLAHLLGMTGGLTETLEPAAPPGHTWAYSNAGIHMLKHVLTTLHGTDLDTLSHELLFAELGLGARWLPRRTLDGGGIVTGPLGEPVYALVASADDLVHIGRHLLATSPHAPVFGDASSATRPNPAWRDGWWLACGRPHQLPDNTRHDRPLVDSAPADAYLAIGAGLNRIYVLPGSGLAMAWLGPRTGNLAMPELAAVDKPFFATIKNGVRHATADSW